MNIYGFDEYQQETVRTAKFPREHAATYLTLGLASEAGEVAGKLKKIIRDNNFEIGDKEKEQIVAELGDVLWYLSQLALELDVTLSHVATKNIEKLNDRVSRNVISGDGDDR
ncbi:MAG: nucleoside triphosphate pyrophosphohydrolase family protein [Bacteroidota bacterium]